MEAKFNIIGMVGELRLCIFTPPPLLGACERLSVRRRDDRLHLILKLPVDVSFYFFPSVGFPVTFFTVRNKSIR